MRNCRAKSVDASGGGEGAATRDKTPPPRNAIGLSSPVGGHGERRDWRAKPVAFRPPPSLRRRRCLRRRGRRHTVAVRNADVLADDIKSRGQAAKIRRPETRSRSPASKTNRKAYWRDEVRCSALVPVLGRRRTNDPRLLSDAWWRASWQPYASSASSSPSLWSSSSSQSWPLYALSLLSLVRISSNKRTLNNFIGLVDSEGRFKDHIHEFSNVRVAASPQFPWFCKLLQRETQDGTLSGTAFLRRLDIRNRSRSAFLARFSDSCSAK
jgi:hypothetical protein